MENMATVAEMTQVAIYKMPKIVARNMQPHTITGI
jgi:hypothetical protein